MKTRKQNQKKAIAARLESALENMYHNATPRHPYTDIPEALWNAYMENFNRAAGFEIEYLSDGLGELSGGLAAYVKYYAEEYKSNAACKRAARRAYRQRHPESVLIADLIAEHGPLYTWGRGGRTLAPDGLIRQRGGSCFSIDTSAADYDEINRADMLELLSQVEAFNSYVERWNSAESLRDIWQNEAEYRAEEYRQERKEARDAFRELAADIKQRADGLGAGPVCDAIRTAARAAFREFQEAHAAALLWGGAAHA